ncbi:MAG: hypothetical protein VSS75_010710 [Candidatus Parabeggiatoa sp.]|nr:hypothetical protein [Candidatus Parabeggiatoa sp.]
MLYYITVSRLNEPSVCYAKYKFLVQNLFCRGAIFKPNLFCDGPIGVLETRASRREHRVSTGHFDRTQ